LASALKNLSKHDSSKIPSAKGMRFALVVSEWNDEITYALRDGAIDTLVKYGAKEKNISVHYVPGSFELTAGAKWVADTKKYDAVICLGCVIQGETRHFDFICNAVAIGLTDLNTTNNIPFIFGVLTPENMQQAKARAGGKHGNKGVEAAVTAIKMAALRSSLPKS
jgi:6,7-dimethyl-8-ribityllumazine synthase